jgi:hypothetical protein
VTQKLTTEVERPKENDTVLTAAHHTVLTEDAVTPNVLTDDNHILIDEAVVTPKLTAECFRVQGSDGSKRIFGKDRPTYLQEVLSFFCGF